jgi:hypothetical protein
MNMLETNVWNNISLSDYEQHMRHETVGQLQLLNGLTKKYLQKYDPSNLLFLGIAGGNGLEHVDVTKAKSMFAVDINNAYLEETEKRFGKRIKHLKLINTDINTSKECLTKADFVWAALILEYTDIDKSFEFIVNNICSSANIIITTQAIMECNL